MLEYKLERHKGFAVLVFEGGVPFGFFQKLQRQKIIRSLCRRDDRAVVMDFTKVEYCHDKRGVNKFVDDLQKAGFRFMGLGMPFLGRRFTAYSLEGAVKKLSTKPVKPGLRKAALV